MLLYSQNGRSNLSSCLLPHWIDPMLFIYFQFMPLECKWKLLLSHLSRGQCSASAVHIWKCLDVWHVSNFVFLALILQLRLTFRPRQRLFNIQIYLEFYTTALQIIIQLDSCEPDKNKHCISGDLYWDHIIGDKICKEDRLSTFWQQNIRNLVVATTIGVLDHIYISPSPQGMAWDQMGTKPLSDPL